MSGALFYALAAGMVLTALGLVVSRNVVHAALFMVVNFVLTAGIYLLLHAPFIAVVQVVVYAGAIMVLFLFVVMLLGQRSVPLSEPLAGQRWLGVPLLLVLLAVLVFVVREGVPAAAPGGVALPAEFGSPGAVGDLLFREFTLPFEVVSALLLAAMIGAVVIARFRGEKRGIGPTSGTGDEAS